MPSHDLCQPPFQQGRILYPFSWSHGSASDPSRVHALYAEQAATGPDHDKEFVMAVFVGEKQMGSGRGNSKQKAQQEAAENALANKEE